MSTAIVWFRRDLRLEDNPAWAAATEAHDEIVPALVIEPALLDTAAPTGAERSSPLRRPSTDRSPSSAGDSMSASATRSASCPPSPRRHAAAVYANADVSRWAQRRDTAVESALGVSIEWHWDPRPRRAPSSPRPARSRGLHPFSKQWFAVPMRPEAVAHDIAVTTDPGDGLPVSDGAESAVLAELRVDAWQADVDAYDDTRTCRRSTAPAGSPPPFASAPCPPDHAEAFGTPLPAARASFAAGVARLYAHITHQFTDIDRRAIRPEYDGIAQTGPAADEEFTAWAEGRTGFPIVDAGMRQLAESGWMHNRVRMITRRSS